MPPKNTPAKSNGFRMSAAEGRAEIFLYDAIDSYSGCGAQDFARELKALGPVAEIHLRINSPGGSIFEGLAIYNLLKSNPAKKTVHIDGIALSMASVVAMAGDEIELADNGCLMIHNPSNLEWGEADDLRSMANLLDSLKKTIVDTYAAQTKDKCTAEEISQLMDAETWLFADDAMAKGFVTKTSGVLAVAAAFDLSKFARCPSQLHNLSTLLLSQGDKPMADTTPATQPATPSTPKAASMKELKASFPDANNDFLVAQCEAESTIDQAKDAWMKELANQAKLLKEENETLKNAGGSGKGVKPVKTAPKNAKTKTACDEEDDAEDLDPEDHIANFKNAVAAQMKAGKSRDRAVAQVVTKHPELHKAYLIACNPSAKSRRLIEEKYEDVAAQ
jgi:ATP-dependent protease ClpP protease subunit